MTIPQLSRLIDASITSILKSGNLVNPTRNRIRDSLNMRGNKNFTVAFRQSMTRLLFQGVIEKIPESPKGYFERTYRLTGKKKASKEKLMKVNICLQEKTLKQVDAYVKEHKMTRSEFFIKAVQRYMEANDGPQS